MVNLLLERETALATLQACAERSARTREHIVLLAGEAGVGSQLSALDAATRPENMNRPGWDLHPLKGGLAGHWTVSVNGNWRLTFAFEDGDAMLVDYQDYH